jgi:hypothetical protein
MRFNRLVSVTWLFIPLLAAGQSQWLATQEDSGKATEAIVASIAANNFSGAMKQMKPLSVVPPAEFVVLPPYSRTRAIRNIALADRCQPGAAVQLDAA